MKGRKKKTPGIAGYIAIPGRHKPVKRGGRSTGRLRVSVKERLFPWIHQGRQNLPQLLQAEEFRP